MEGWRWCLEGIDERREVGGIRDRGKLIRMGEIGESKARGSDDSFAAGI